MSRALIFGVTGQDGSYLASFLLKKNYTVFGTSRKFLSDKLLGLKSMGIESKIHKINADLAYPNSIRKAIDEFFEEGAQKRQERYFENWETLTKGLREKGFNLLLEDDVQSKILTSILEPKNPEYDFNKLHDLLYEKGFTIYPGKIGSMNTFRIANLGAINKSDIQDFINALKDTLNEMGIQELIY